MAVTAFVKGVLFLFHPTFTTVLLFHLHDGVNVPIGVFLFLF